MGAWSNDSRPEVTSEIGKLPLIWLIVLSAVSLIGSAGNALIAVSVCLKRRTRMRANLFVINLAIADLLVTAYVMPVGLVTSFYGLPPSSDVACDVNAFLVTWACVASIQFVTFVAVERYVKICKLFWYWKIFNRKWIPLYVTVCWVYAGCWASQGWTRWTAYAYVPEANICMFLTSYRKSYDACLAVFGLFLPMSLMTFSYVSISRTIRRSTSTMSGYRLTTNVGDQQPEVKRAQTSRRRRRDVRLAVTLFTTMAVFVSFWCLPGLTLVLAAFGIQMPIRVRKASVWLALSNSGANCLIHGILNRTLRQRYAALLTRLRTLCRRKRSHTGSQLPEVRIHSLDNPDSSRTRRGTSDDVIHSQINVTRPQNSADSVITDFTESRHNRSPSARVRGESRMSLPVWSEDSTRETKL